MMRKIVCLILLLSPYFISAQTSKLLILDRGAKKPVTGISVLTESGSLIGSTDEKGEFLFDPSSFDQLSIKKLMFYNIDYQSAEVSVLSLPSVIYLDKIKDYNLKPVEVTTKRTAKYFTLTAYVRSWKLVNDKLVRYGDANVDYQVPFEHSKHPFHLEKNKYIKEFRNFKIDSIKAKSKVVSISLNDNFMRLHLPAKDLIASMYTAKKVKDSLYAVYDEDKNIGYAIYDEQSFPSEINVSRSFEGEEAIKIALWWKIAGKSKNIEKWTGTGDTRHPVYLFSDRKMLVRAGEKGKFNTEEIVTEIFVSDKIGYTDIVPAKYKTLVNIDQSFYNSAFWAEETKRHPLPGFIQEQLNTVKELGNIYK